MSARPDPQPNEHRPPEISIDFGTDVIPDMLQSCDIASLIAAQRRLKMLCSLGWTICESTQLPEILSAAMAAIKKLTEAERCFVITRCADQSLHVRASYPVPLPLDPSKWTISRTIVDRVLNTGRALLSSDASEEFDQVASVRSKNIRSVICVPLGFRSNTIGVIYADNRAEEGVFDELELRFLTALGHFVYLSLRNAAEIARVDEQRQLSDDRWKTLQKELLKHQIVGTSQPMLQAFERLRQVASTNRPLLLLGPTGVGKDLFAKAAHSLSSRHGKPFVRVDAASLSEDLIESELFGHVSGAFTHAVRDKRGRFELADGGTLFLDEVGNIPLRIQAKLLRVLESGEFERVGGETTVKSDVRLISATNVDLEAAIRKGTFREDLYFRIAGVSIRIPALQNRLEDIPELVQHILAELKSSKQFDGSALQRLQAYSWPGNVRQLMRVVGEVDAICQQALVTANDIPAHVMPTYSSGDSAPMMEMRDILELAEGQHVQRALAMTNGNNNEAIRLLNISREKFFKIKKRLSLQSEE